MLSFLLEEREIFPRGFLADLIHAAQADGLLSKVCIFMCLNLTRSFFNQLPMHPLCQHVSLFVTLGQTVMLDVSKLLLPITDHLL